MRTFTERWVLCSSFLCTFLRRRAARRESIRPSPLVMTALLCFLAPAAFSQLTLNWTRNVGFIPTAVVVDPSGNVYLAGDAGNYALVKYSPGGNLVWDRRLPTNGQCNFSPDADLAIDSQSNLIITHRKWSEAESGCICAMTKFDPNGNELWSKTSPLGCDFVAIDGADGVNVFGKPGISFSTQKYSTDGTLQWAAYLAGNYASYTFGIAAHTDGAVYLLTNGPQTDNDDIVLAKFSPSGTEEWAATYNGGTGADDWPGGIVLDSAGNAYVVGYSDTDGEDGPNGHDIVTLKYSPNGQLVWSRRYTSGQTGYGSGDLYYDPWPAAITLDTQGNVVVAGRSPGGTATKYDYAVIKYDPNGTELWSRRYNGPGNCDDQARDVVTSPAGNVYVVGVSVDSCPPNNAASLYVAQYDSAGSSIGQDRQPGQGYISSFDYRLKEARIRLTQQGSAYVMVGADLRKYACVALTPPNVSVSYLATSGTVGVASHSGCAATWTATSDSPWLTVTSGSSGSGNGSVGYSVTQNPTVAERVGRITIGEATFTVTQGSDPCVLVTPTNLSAQPSYYYVRITWNAAAGTRYEVQRKNYYSFGFETISSNATSPFIDDFTFPDIAYLYRARAVSDCTMSAFSNSDLVTIVSFTDDPLAAGATPVRGAHITELRGAVNAVRKLASLSPGTYTDNTLTGVAIKAVHISELRTQLNAALTALGLPAPGYTDPTLTPGATIIKKAHVQELRDATK
ncbi:MAG TPA: SBBP repeat-containing protein [Thermoanaerobaculia bacterium]